MSEKQKVLVVDDDRRMVKTICDILAAKGHEPIAAYSGEEAIASIRGATPDCVFMDIRMSGIDGVEALAAMKKIAPALPVVLMSAYATEEKVAEARRQGAYTVLNKPFDVQQVLSFLSLLRKEVSLLLVDDDPAFSRTLRDILQARGYRVVTETAPEKVLGHMEEIYQLVVLLDLKLGNADGLDVLRKIRAKYSTKPVILVTGYGREMGDSIEKGMQIGAYSCLHKPLEIDRLTEVIEDIRRKKLRAFLGESFT